MSPLLIVRYHIKNRSSFGLQYGCLEQYQIFSFEDLQYQMSSSIQIGQHIYSIWCRRSIVWVAAVGNLCSMAHYAEDLQKNCKHCLRITRFPVLCQKSWRFGGELWLPLVPWAPVYYKHQGIKVTVSREQHSPVSKGLCKDRNIFSIMQELCHVAQF